MVLRDADPVEVGGYLIEDRLGSGGMGVVFLARSASGRRLAVKVVHEQYADDAEFRTRFRRELTAARQVSGAFTAPVVDADADAGRPWMATLYIPGQNLTHHVREHGPLPPAELRDLAAGLAEALRDIHRAGVVHRDLKPANVMLAEDGPRVIDFGISRATEFGPSDALTQTGRVMGTPPFMSPEQFSAPQDVGPAADVFSLGAVLTFAATGRGPFDGGSPYETAVRVVEGDPDLTDVPAELAGVIRRCLAKHPEDRPTAHELLTLVGERGTPPERRSADWLSDPAAPDWPDSDTVLRADRVPAPEPASASEPSAAPAGDRSRRRGRLLGWGAAAVALAAVASGLLSLRSEREQGSTAVKEPVAASDLPSGWQPWRTKAEGDSGGFGEPLDCERTRKTLVCAGSDLMGAGWNLADGRGAWSRPVQSAEGDGGHSDRGAVLGLHRGNVLVYGEEPEDPGSGSPSRALLLSLDAVTGKEKWRTVTGKGGWALSPTPDNTAVVPEGVIARYGDYAESYALLDPDDGRVRWKRPMPAGANQTLEEAAGAAYWLVEHEPNTKSVSTDVVRLDPATGTARWTVGITGTLRLLGESDGRLVLADTSQEEPALVLLDPETRAVTRTVLSPAPAEGFRSYLAGDTVYLTWDSGTLRAYSPLTGRRAWENNSTVEHPGPPAVSATRVYVASRSGRLAAMDRRTGEITASRPGFDDAGRGVSLSFPGPRPLLVGDALYVSYGDRSVYTVDVNRL
ncbi:protein kinase [Streptomyces sp. NPDC005017]|uniref:serine/threonine-protein kinase n=1 Tax=Streptomyces sp. NPDC005017 TaxID=3364706 RepID=UPI0036B7FFA1